MATASTEITELKTNTLGENTFQSRTQTEAGMAAQARHYEKSISYSSSRQGDDKYSTKNHQLLKSSLNNRSSSPYKPKSNSAHTSPSSRKRSHDSPSTRHMNSPYETAKKRDRLNDSFRSLDNSLNESDWSQHVSSSGKVYYFNRKTEESQWEVPRDWIEKDRKNKEPPRDRLSSQSKDQRNFKNSYEDKYIRDINKDSRELRDYKNSRGNFESKDSRYKDSRDYGKDSRDYTKDSRDYRREKSHRSDSRSSRDSYDSRDSPRSSSSKDYRDRESKYDSKYRSPISSSGRRSSSKYPSSSASSMKTVGLSSPSSSTSLNRSHRGTPETFNGSSGTVQDISPPGTPTSDDTITHPSNISTQPLFTPPIINAASLSVAAAARLVLQPQLVTTPILSPNILFNNGVQLAQPYLHPLQQALLLKQQVQVPTVSQDLSYVSPKLPSVKNHLGNSGSTPSSPLITTLQQSQQSVSPIPPQRVANTPPPPPPPLKENQPHIDVKERSLKYDRILSRSTSSPRDKAKMEYNTELSRSKSVDYRNDETPLKMSFKASEARFNLERSAGKKQEKLNFDNQLVFPELPDLQRYAVDYATNISDFTQTFFGTSFDRQADASWDEARNVLHQDGYRSKYSLLSSRGDLEMRESKLDVFLNWVGALNSVLFKMDDMKDSNVAAISGSTENKRDSKLYANRKPKNENNSTNELKINGEINDLQTISNSSSQESNDSTDNSQLSRTR